MSFLRAFFGVVGVLLLTNPATADRVDKAEARENTSIVILYMSQCVDRSPPLTDREVTQAFAQATVAGVDISDPAEKAILMAMAAQHLDKVIASVGIDVFCREMHPIIAKSLSDDLDD